MWRAAPQEQKQPYLTAAEADRDRYNEEMRQYNARRRSLFTHQAGTTGAAAGVTEDRVTPMHKSNGNDRERAGVPAGKSHGPSVLSATAPTALGVTNRDSFDYNFLSFSLSLSLSLLNSFCSFAVWSHPPHLPPECNIAYSFIYSFLQTNEPCPLSTFHSRRIIRSPLPPPHPWRGGCGGSSGSHHVYYSSSTHNGWP